MIQLFLKDRFYFSKLKRRSLVFKYFSKLKYSVGRYVLS
jgi:hypothetical protein